MKKIAIFILLLTKLCHAEEPIYIAGGGYCEPAIEEFLSRAKPIVLTQNIENVRENFLSYNLCIVDSKEKANDPNIIRVINNTKSLYITGGDQFHYHRLWKETELNRSIQNLFGKIPIYCTSASAMILGETYFTAENGTYNGGNKDMITLSDNFFSLDIFKGVIIDTHYSERNRSVRLQEFCEISNKKGIGIDENTCLKVHNGYTKYGNGNVHLINMDLVLK